MGVKGVSRAPFHKDVVDRVGRGVRLGQDYGAEVGFGGALGSGNQQRKRGRTMGEHGECCLVAARHNHLQV
jgi:hypothetical protein